MGKILAGSVRRAEPVGPKPYTLRDEITATTVDVVLRRLNDLENDRALERADELIRRYVHGDWFDEATKRFVEEPDMEIAANGMALPVSEGALRLACRFCAAQVVEDEDDRYGPIEFLDLCNSAEGIYAAAYEALADVSVRPKASTGSETSPSTAPSPSA